MSCLEKPEIVIHWNKKEACIDVVFDHMFQYSGGEAPSAYRRNPNPAGSGRVLPISDLILRIY
jgi:hypothetical protein